MRRYESVFFNAAQLLAAAMEDGNGAPRHPRDEVRQRTAARGLVLTENVRERGGKKSRRKTARVWEPPT